MALIKLEGVKKSFGKGRAKTTVLRGIKLSINESEFVSIMGASGSGKTTLMNIIGLLDRADQGTYHLGDDNVAHLNDSQLALRRREHIGFVFQSFNLLGRLKAADNVELPMIYARLNRAERKHRVGELLKLVGLENRGNYKPSVLSGGEMQRVAIARALANKPSIVLADEPTGNLDSKTGDMVMKLFEKLHHEGNTIIVVTHDLNVARRTHKIVRVKDGKIAR